MKKIVSLFIICLCCAGSVFSQKRPAPKSKSTTRISGGENVVKFNPLSLFARTASLSYERVISDYVSVQLGMQYTFPRKARLFGKDILGENGSLNRFAITPELRYFPGGEAPNGLYLAPFVRYAHASVSGEIEKTINGQPQRIEGKLTQNTYSLGGLAGMQWIMESGISLEVYVGPYFSVSNLSASSNLSEDDYKVPFSANIPVWIRGGLTIGYTF